MRTRPISQQGFALIAVSAALALIGVITTQFSYNTGIDFQSAKNARDEMRAHFLARSGMNLSRLVVRVQRNILDKYRRYIGDLQLADYLPLMVGAFGGGKEEVEAMVASLGIEGGGAGGELKGLGLPEGEFDVQVTTDDGRINVNCANGSTATQKQLELKLVALVASQAYDKVFEGPDGDGQITDRATFVRAIMDWADRDTAGYGVPGSPEDYGYESRGKYKARDNYLDSIEELRLVRGMDDRRWALFGPAFTIYGDCRVNVSSATDLNVIAALIAGAAKDENDPILRDVPRLYALAMRVAQARGMGIMFEDLNAFIEYVKDPDAQSLIGALGPDGQPLTGGQQAQQPTGPRIQGVELDAAKLGQIAKAGPRRTYRVTATAKMGKVEKSIVGVWDADVVVQNPRDPADARGTWVYWREE